VSTPLPKADDALKKAMFHLRSDPRFREFMKYQQALSDYYRGRLVNAPLQDVPGLQGRAAQLQDFFDLLKE
jgi:hypothetical protein